MIRHAQVSRRALHGLNNTGLGLTRFASGRVSAKNNIASVLSMKVASESANVDITGHVRTIRNQKKWSFVEIGDGSTSKSLQALLNPQQASGLSTGTAVKISGEWKPCPPGKEQTHELHAEKVEVLGVSDPELYPLQKKYHGADFLRTIPHFRLRLPKNALITRLRSECEHAFSSHLREEGFVRVYPPLITSSDCEGAGEVFTVRPHEDKSASGPSEMAKPQSPEFFRTEKFLTVSSQLHLEAYVHEHPRVWTLSPTFRAEKSDTPRHLSEFYMLEAELRTQRLDDVMDAVEGMIRYVATHLASSALGSELLNQKSHGGDEENARQIDPKAIEERWVGLQKSYWPRISYTKAIELLQSAAESGDEAFQYKPDWHAGLQLEHEKYIASTVGRGSPVFVTDYPQAVKPFYMPPSESAGQKGQTVSCFDLLMPEVCEVVGGSLREHRLEELRRSMTSKGLLNPQDMDQPHTLDWYLDLRRFGSVPHGGFGMGYDRLLCYLSGVDNIRDVVPWPRYYGRCDG